MKGAWMRIGLIRCRTRNYKGMRMGMITHKLMLFLFYFCCIRAKIFVAYVIIIQSICHVTLYLITLEIYRGNHFIYGLCVYRFLVIVNIHRKIVIIVDYDGGIWRLSFILAEILKDFTLFNVFILQRRILCHYS